MSGLRKVSVGWSKNAPVRDLIIHILLLLTLTENLKIGYDKYIFIDEIERAIIIVFSYKSTEESAKNLQKLKEMISKYL